MNAIVPTFRIHDHDAAKKCYRGRAGLAQLGDPDGNRLRVCTAQGGST